jgi:RHS repeat-associated protein
MKDYVYLGRVPIVRIESPGGSARHYITLVTDHLGSTRAEVLDATSADPEYHTLDYWPYGELVSHPGITLETHLFTAHERDYVGDAAGTCSLEALDFMHARYYSVSYGRFLCVDPLGPELGGSQSLSLFSYVIDNPINLIDPFGLEWIDHDGQRAWAEEIIVTAEESDRERAERFLMDLTRRSDLDIMARLRAQPRVCNSSDVIAEVGNYWRTPILDEDCFDECMKDSGANWVALGSPLPLANLKTPREYYKLRKLGTHPFTSLDRRLPGGNIKWTFSIGKLKGPYRMAASRAKPIGMYGTAVAVVGTFSISYYATSFVRCSLACNE